MTGKACVMIIVVWLLLFVASAAAQEVTLKGVMMTEVSCTAKPEKGDDKTLVLFAVEGPPEVAAAVDAIVKENWEGDSIDGDQARKIQEAFEKRLKYYITPGAIEPKEGRWRNPAKAVTGVVSEKDGARWITASKIEPTRLKYPDKMLAPDKPFAMPGREPLILKVDDKLSLKCILLPAGKYFAGVPFYATYDGDARYDDDFPAMLTLTRPFYLAEIPVTQEMYEAVMGNNPSEQKGPRIPVTRVSSIDIRKFCRILSEKNNRNVRLPTQAEWEWAARVGTSNPPFNKKCANQINAGPDGKTFLPVKSRQPNAWGLYDMICVCSWEIIRDRRQFSRKDAVDPYYPIRESRISQNAMGRTVCSYTTTREGVGDGSGTGYTLTRFRIAVDATPEEAAEMSKAGKRRSPIPGFRNRRTGQRFTEERK